MPQVSVIIPCFNSGEYLEEAIDSINKQSYKDYEIIVVDDGSTDPETITILKSLAATGLKIIRKENGGLASARNFGIKHASGSIILTLDSDDKFHSTFLKKAVDILNTKKEIGVVSSYVKEFGESNKVWRSSAYNDFSFLLENRIVACCAFRKKCWTEVEGYDENMKHGFEDWEFWIRVTKNGWKVHVIPETLFYYRKKVSSMLVDDTRPKMNSILDYMMNKHKEWFLSSLKKGIIQKKLINKKNLTPRRIIGLLIEKIRGEF